MGNNNFALFIYDKEVLLQLLRKNNYQEPLKIILVLCILSLIFALMLIINNTGSIDYRSFFSEIFGKTSRWANTFGPRHFVNLNKRISLLGGPKMMIVIAVFLSIYFLISKEYISLGKFIITSAGAGILLFILKFTFNAARPDSFMDFVFADNLSFPSGHAMASVVVYSFLTEYGMKKILFLKGRIFPLYLLIILIFTIGLSRIIIGAHSPWEVIAGWSSGLFWILLIKYIFRIVRK